MPRESAAVKARRYLSEGRVVLTAVSSTSVTAMVRGDGMFHRCSYSAGAWACTCPVRSGRCSHLLAVRLVVAVDLDP